MRGHSINSKWAETLLNGLMGPALFVILFSPITCAYGDTRESQRQSQDMAARSYRNSSNAAQRAGNNSIGRGNSNVRHGHSHGPAGAAQAAMGAFQIAQGILGLLASAKAGQMSDQDLDKADKLDAITNSDINSKSTSQSFGSGGNSATANIGGKPEEKAADFSQKLALLQNAELNAALAAVEETFGIAPDQFISAMESGIDPRTLMMRAPKNPLDAELANAAFAAVAESISNRAEPAAMEEAKIPEVKVASTIGPKDGALRDVLRRKLASLDADYSAEVSPEIREALAVEAANTQRKTASVKPNSQNLFEVVHQKYQEKLGMLGRKFDVGKNGNSGVAGENGY